MAPEFWEKDVMQDDDQYPFPPLPEPFAKEDYAVTFESAGGEGIWSFMWVRGSRKGRFLTIEAAKQLHGVLAVAISEAMTAKLGS